MYKKVRFAKTEKLETMERTAHTPSANAHGHAHRPRQAIAAMSTVYEIVKFAFAIGMFIAGLMKVRERTPRTPVSAWNQTGTMKKQTANNVKISSADKNIH